jgi:hypothetical protein
MIGSKHAAKASAYGPKGQENIAQALAWVDRNKRDQPCKGV